MKRNRLVALFFALVAAGNVDARTLPLPANPADSVAREYAEEVRYTPTDQGGTLLEVALRNDLGQTEIVQLNPEIDRWLTKEGDMVRLPNLRILPNAPRTGIVLNVAEMRMYYYPASDKGVVRTYPIGIGREGWNTPLGVTKIIDKVKDPTWTPPESIRREHAADGDILKPFYPPGPDNPLGRYAMYLGFSGYRIHGTDKPYSIGLRATHGCTRMYADDIEELFHSASIGTPVNIINQPVKAGWLDNALYVEIHPGLEGEELSFGTLYQHALTAIQRATNNAAIDIDKAALKLAIEKADGIPAVVFSGKNINSAPSINATENTGQEASGMTTEIGTPIGAPDTGLATE